MNQINNLIRRAKKVVSCAGLNAFCLIDYDENKNKWIATPQVNLHSASMCSSIPIRTEYDTADEAAKEINAFFESLNILNSDRLVFLMDYGGS